MDGREKYGLVQVLRGFAAMWVVLFHASEGRHIDILRSDLQPWVLPIFDLGNNGVAIFFALSGFVIAHSISGDRINLRYIGRFALRRSIRLDPAYWASILLFVAFAALSAMVKHEVFALPSWQQVLSNATYTQLFLGYESINTVYWTLCYEVQFYLVLVLCVLLAQRLGRWIYVVPFAIAVAFGTGLMINHIPGLFVDRWHCFYLGALAYWSRKSKSALLGFALLSVALLASQPVTFTLVSLATAVCLLIALRTGFIRDGLVSRPTLFLGTISYSLYLTHNPITGASFFILNRFGVSQPIALAITIVCCIIVAVIFWMAIERPTMNFAHRIRLRPPAEVESGFATDAVPAQT